MHWKYSKYIEDIITSLILSGKPEWHPEYTSSTRHVPQNPPASPLLIKPIHTGVSF
jgi:hypothetical protein